MDEPSTFIEKALDADIKGLIWWRFTDSNRGPVDYDEEKYTGL
jgi:hypothetical protein